ncbi:c-di-GMP-binding flagellar brake protein YcgR [Marmoricola sp. URHA0025 HA25]
MEEHPEINDPVVLRGAAGDEYPSRVVNLSTGLVVVAQPRDLPGDAAYGAGTDVSVEWADSDNAVMVLPTRILAVHGDDELWSLVVTGAAAIGQRRRFERVDATGPVELRPAEGNDTAAVTGTLVDISEVALRCSIETGSADGFLGQRNQVVAAFRLGTADFAIPGRVEFARGTKRPMETEELVVLFDEPVPDPEELRKQVYGQ